LVAADEFLPFDQFLRNFGENRVLSGENSGVSSRSLCLKIRVSGVQFPPWPPFHHPAMSTDFHKAPKYPSFHGIFAALLFGHIH
jgi:hypothetical protein